MVDWCMTTLRFVTTKRLPLSRLRSLCRSYPVVNMAQKSSNEPGGNTENYSSFNRPTQITTHHQYYSSGLAEKELLDDPISLFKKWFDAACQSSLVSEPEAMCFATATNSGEVSSRFVLLKSFDSRGFVFFTNYHSRKARELDSNPNASMAFYWGPLHQQIRICGRTEKTSAEETAQYFKTRPVGSQIGAWASPQSNEIPNREHLTKLVSDQEVAFGVEPGSVDRKSPLPSDLQAQIAVPSHWGGIRLIPHEIEFWVGLPNRLHDRFVYRRKPSSRLSPSSWTRQRLAP
ncbi:hypothetical protein O181_028072 [Austropuccinia psidii MF-1]|uniref:pyridoxal 5'-phosphate synthase n=1 Tax=Austropuccinia psidii MF-1 TaxID=1389203 RepID=A0A9Q3CTV3_9BASI|nr:hypothetical protein [Austropuccinia psidii MF-1]